MISVIIIITILTMITMLITFLYRFPDYGVDGNSISNIRLPYFFTVFFTVFFYRVLPCFTVFYRVATKDSWEEAGGVFVLHTDTEDTIRQLRDLGLNIPDLGLRVSDVFAYDSIDS